jgi:hypothetical protein
VTPYLKLTTSRIPLGGQAVKHRQLARQVGVRIEDPPANSMASFKFTSVVLPEGTTLVFSSWVCVADGAGDFRRLTIDIMKPKTLAASFHSELDEFVDNLDDLVDPWLHQEDRGGVRFQHDSTPCCNNHTRIGLAPI